MQLGKNMAYRLDQAIILSSALICASCGAGANQKSVSGKAWDHKDDAEYFVSRPERGGVAYSSLLAAAQATVGIDGYGSVADKISIESERCPSWIVFQEVDAGNGQIDGTLLCRKSSGQWQGRRFGFTGAAIYYGPLWYRIDKKKADQIILALNEPRIDFKNYTVLDGAALFVAKYDGSLVRSAIYAPTQSADALGRVASSTHWSLPEINAFLEALEAQ